MPATISTVAGTKDMCSGDKKGQNIDKVDERADKTDEIDMEEASDGSNGCVVVKGNGRRFLPSLAVTTLGDPLKEYEVIDASGDESPCHEGKMMGMSRDMQLTEHYSATDIRCQSSRRITHALIDLIECQHSPERPYNADADLVGIGSIFGIDTAVVPPDEVFRHW